MSIPSILQNSFKQWCNGRTNNLTLDGKINLNNKSVVPVVQQTSATTPVTYNGERGYITTFALTTIAGDSIKFVLNNTSIEAGDSVYCIIRNYSGTTGVPLVSSSDVVNNTCNIIISNMGGAVLNGTVNFLFVVVHTN